MHSKILASLGLIGTVISASAFAEPPIQPGDTLESLSQAKVTTTVNGQPGSIQELVSSGQIKLLDPNAAPISPAGQGVPNDQAVMPTAPQSEAPVQQAVPDTTAQQAEAALNDAVAPTANTDMNAAPAAAPQLDSSAEVPVNAVEPDSLPSPDAPAQALPDASAEQPVQAMPEAPVNDPIN
ncbi:hypothetical protein N5E66_07550 [Acinetobacter johnsonii]|uniref:hypothetical protein n=1 Tax=Acinetobacter johnsonii TaxID=40214 RepID=UPI002447DE81|nr:hypothetical protein [Acinetobacter johnsonii]MDH1488052.1 hypothetical protein [Acinetobacter johnsonii]MDH1613984.1 hypothetical protein [Acinetobacter johnsonii]